VGKETPASAANCAWVIFLISRILSNLWHRAASICSLVAIEKSIRYDSVIAVTSLLIESVSCRSPQVNIKYNLLYIILNYGFNKLYFMYYYGMLIIRPKKGENCEQEHGGQLCYTTG
jgi:hypothetical protein